MAYDFSLGINDTHATITISIKDQDGVKVPLDSGVDSVDCVVIFEDKWKQTKEMVISDGPNGVCTVQFNAGMLREGINEIYAVVNWTTGKESYSVTEYKIRGLRI